MLVFYRKNPGDKFDLYEGVFIREGSFGESVRRYAERANRPGEYLVITTSGSNAYMYRVGPVPAEFEVERL